MDFVQIIRRLTLVAFFSFSVVSAQLLGGSNLAVLKVGTTEFTQGKVDSLTKLLAAQQLQGQQPTPEILQQIRWAVIDNLVGQELLRIEAKKQNLKADSKKIDSLITLFKAQFKTEEQFKSELARSGATMEQFTEKVRNQVISDDILEKAVPYPKDPTEADRKAYFKKHQSEAKINDTISGVQIYLNLEKGESKQGIEDKKSILRGLAAQVRASKAKDLMSKVQAFQMMAAQYSDDPEARQTGGLMTPFKASTLGKEFAKIIKSLKIGDISEVFETPKGVHIFLLTEKNDGQYESYVSKIDYILRIEAERERQMKIKAYLDQLAAKYPVVYLNQDYTPPTAIGAKK